MEKNKDIPSLRVRLENPYYNSPAGDNITTERVHFMRGYCCGKQCIHCPFWPKYREGNKNLKLEVKEAVKKYYGIDI